MRTVRLLDYVNSIFVALVTGQVSKEITDIGNEIEQLFGVLDEDVLKLQ